ncbi:MAG: PTS sugar transporter subunit IIB [Anaerorhabdus sp.]|uniref:PTS sugar transporter subunit IIB n=1 Tax=Anaerorhabdus sp. TaxID=1872524 RepID=UPI003A8A45CA
MKVNSIMCCCGSGLGSSMLVKMNVEKVLKKLDITGIDIIHSSVSDAIPGAADLFVVGSDLENFTKNLPCVIYLDNIVSLPELEEKLSKFFSVCAE